MKPKYGMLRQLSILANNKKKIISLNFPQTHSIIQFERVTIFKKKNVNMKMMYTILVKTHQHGNADKMAIISN